MENLTDISEPQVPENKQKDQYINFLDLFIQVSIGEVAFIPLELNKRMEN